MRPTILATLGPALIALLALPAGARVSKETLQSLSTPDKVETRLGTLEFKDGAPSAATAQTVYDTLDFTRALNVYNNSFRGASAYAIAKGLESIGAGYNDVVIFSDLMDAKSLFLTANADTVYYLAAVDLTNGPMVIEQPPMGLGTINDMWFSWIIDIGRPGPDRGLGGKYLIVPPGYDGPLPEGGYFIAHSKTDHVLYAARSFLVDNDPKPAVENIKANMKIYPYAPGSYGTSIAEALEGKVKLAAEPKVPETKFVEASGLSFNTIPPSDYGFFEMINENVQNEPATSYDVELAGQLAAIGIVKGKPFAPDERMKKILTDAAAVGSAFGRALNWRFDARHPDWAYYPGSHWMNMLFEGGAFFETPPPLFEDGMFKPFAPTGARTLNSRTAFYYAYTLDSPAMIMRIPDVGLAVSDGLPRRGRRAVRRREDLQGDAAQGHPGARVLVLHALRQSDALDAADAAALPARRQPELSVARRRSRRRRLDDGLLQLRNSPRGSSAATGSRPCPARAGSRSFASTARCPRSSTRPGARAKSSW